MAYKTPLKEQDSPLFAELDEKRRELNLSWRQISEILNIPYDWLNNEYNHGHKRGWPVEYEIKIVEFLK
jgi:hypothetical protein